MKLLGGTLLAATGMGAGGRDEPRQSLDVGAAINKAGRQRMLTQRMAKAYLMLVQGVLPDRAKSILLQSVKTFETQLGELKGFLPNEDIRIAYSGLEHQWKGYRELLRSAPSTEGARQLYETNEAVLVAAHRLTLTYERSSGTPAARLVNVSGRQRMLSQRMAKFFLFRQTGVNASAAASELETARKEFTAAHAELLAASLSTPQISAELALVEQQWLFFEYAIGIQDQERQRAATNVATTSERILDVMEGVVSLYERLAV